MAEIARFTSTDGSVMLVEVDDPRRLGLEESDVEEVSDGAQGVVTVATRIEDSLSSVGGVATALMTTLDAVQSKGGLALDEATLEFGLSFAAEGGVIVAKGKAEAKANIALTWRRAT